MPRYKHQPLGQSHIRLLHLQPDGPLQGTLQHYPRSKAPPYTAISYCWGHKPASILIDTFPLPITQNLHDALTRLRGGTFWADAICINQSDDDEKGEQVGQMKSIYEEAHHTAVWLGNEDLDLSVFHRLRAWGSPEQLFIGSAKVMDPKWSLTDTEIHTIQTVYGSPWFTRVWIVQEAAVSKEVVVVQGDSNIPWSTLAVVTSLLAKHRMNSMFFGRRKYTAGKVISAIEVYRSTKYWPTIFELTTSLQCTDPRDHWFGISALAPFDSPKPDYHKSQIQIWMEASAELIMRGQIWILRYANSEGLMPHTLPSWVANLAQFPGLSPGNDQCSSGGISTDASVVGKTLHLPIWIVDSLSSIIPGSDFYTQGEDEVFAHSKRLLLETASHGTKQYITGEDGRQAYLRTLICDAKLNNDMCDMNDLAEVESFVQMWTTTAERVKLGRGSIHLVRTRGRSFTVSERGFIGWVPRNAQPGDKICIVQGADLPFIFRKGTPGLVLIGECYIHGIMYDMVENNSIRFDKKHLVPTERVKMKIV